MIDINTIISQALAAAVQQATAPLLERIAALEAQSANRHERLRVLEGALTDRVAALENNPAQGVDTTLEQAAVNKDAHERQLFVLQHLTARVAALENNPAQGVDTTLNAWEMAMQNRVDSADAVAKRLHERVTALEKHTAVLDQHGGILEYLDNQEWFWEKVSRYIINNSDITVDELHNIKERLEKITTASDARIQELVEEALDAHLENANHPDDDDIDTKIDSAIEQHEENRTHGDNDDIEEIVQKLLNSASISISV